MKKINAFLMLLMALQMFMATGQIVDIHTFTGTTGAYPYGSLTLSGQILYGMTYQGGLYNQGCVFAVDTNGNNYRDLYDFHDSTGEEPRGSLLLANGLLYGMTTLGGSDNDGNLFRVDTGGNNYKNLVDFNHVNGGSPWGSVIMLGSKLYGMTEGGGTNGDGVIFSVDTNGSNYNILLSFLDNDTSGSSPDGDLIFVNGRFYGMTQSGGRYLDGTIFSVDSNGHNFRDLVDLWGSIAPLGQYPKGSLTYSNGVLYGTVEQGGSHDLGVVFSVDTNGNNYKILQDFSGTNGNDPAGNLLLKGGTLFGTTIAGGTHSAGNIFSIDTDGSNFTDLEDFDGTHGSSLNSSLTLANGILYGTAYQGAGGEGAVFSTNICKMKVSVVNGPNEPCYGSTVGMAVANITQGNAPFTFQWTAGGGVNDTAANLGAGIYAVTVTDNFGCSGTGADTITQPATALTVAVDSLPQTSQTCNGVAAVTAAGGTAPYTYLWQPGSQITDTITNLCAGSYCCVITDNNGCTDTACITVSSATAINTSIKELGISVYPEPNNGYFTVEGTTPGQIIELYNCNGQRISCLVCQDSSTRLNISDKANGMYLIRLLSENGNLVSQQKVIKVQ